LRSEKKAPTIALTFQTIGQGARVGNSQEKKKGNGGEEPEGVGNLSVFGTRGMAS